MRVSRLICAAAVAAPLAACFDPPPPPPPPPENIFAAATDRVLVRQAMTDVANNPAVLGSRQFTGLVISDDPKGRWRAVCGQGATPGGTWRDFVAIAEPGPAINSLAVRGDNLTPAQQASCKPVVIKYLGEWVSTSKAEKAFAAADCTSFDPTYWYAWKKFCSGKLTLPSATPTPQ
jgi:hypothetical protein